MESGGNEREARAARVVQPRFGLAYEEARTRLGRDQGSTKKSVISTPVPPFQISNPAKTLVRYHESCT